MELLQLRYFYETSLSEKITQTAKKYGVPASSVSASIKRLEEELGRRLFDRKSNRICLNENGRAFQSDLHTVFQKLDNAVSNIAREPEQKTVRVLVLITRDMVNKAVIAYRKIHPEVSFVIDIASREEHEPYHLIVAEKTDRFPGRVQTELAEKDLYLVVAIDSPLADQTLTLSQLQFQPFVCLGSGHSNWLRLVKACRRAGFTPKVAVETEDLICHKALIYQGVGIGVSRGTLSPEQTAILNVTDFNERQTICAYTHAVEKDETVEDFLLFLKKRSQFI